MDIALVAMAEKDLMVHGIPLILNPPNIKYSQYIVIYLNRSTAAMYSILGQYSAVEIQVGYQWL